MTLYDPLAAVMLRWIYSNLSYLVASTLKVYCARHKSSTIKQLIYYMWKQSIQLYTVYLYAGETAGNYATKYGFLYSADPPELCIQ